MDRDCIPAAEFKSEGWHSARPASASAGKRIRKYLTIMKMFFGITLSKVEMSIPLRPMMRLNKFRLTPALRTLSAVFVGMFLFSISAQAENKQLAAGQVAPLVASGKLQPISRLAGTNRLSLAIGLPLRNQELLDQLLRQLYDPSSPSYHHFLTPRQFTEQFGPADSDYQALIAFAKANGLIVTSQHPNRMLLSISGAVSDIENAFQVKMQVYQHPKEARTFYSPDVEPSVPSALSVADISGLNNYVLPHPKYKIQPSNTSPKSGSGPAGNYRGNDFRAAYVPGTTLNGAGQVVGLLQFDGYFASDITAYETQAGLPNVTLENVLLDGYNGFPTGNGGEVEVSLDIEMVISMAPGVSKVVLYEAGPFGIPNDILNRMATDNEAKQISSSWGWSGGPQTTTEQIFQQMAAQGQTFFNATGDSDAFLPGQVEDPFYPGSPSSSPNITQVGGTTLKTSGPGGSWVSETVWNWGNRFGTNFDGVGTSGGFSSFYPIPVWQQGIDMTLNQGSTTFRNMPDVALTGDDVYVIADNGIGYIGVGGTSCASPLWAGFTALVNQQATQYGDPAVGFLNPAIYSIGKSSAYNSSFHDTVTGDDTWSASPNLFFAIPGYDLCAGWGTPVGTNLINILAPPNGVALVVSTNYLFGGNGNGFIDPNECNSLLVVLANVGLIGATNVQATLSTSTPKVIITTRTSSYPAIPAGATATNLVPFQISTAPDFICGTPVNFVLTVKTDQGSRTNSFTIYTGAPGTPLRYDSVAVPVQIPDNSPAGADSPITVSGFSSALQKATVSLYLTHTYDSDLLLELVSPDGVTNVLAANVGGSGDNFGSSCADGSRTVFDDGASIGISQGSPAFVGSYRPAQPLSIFNGRTGTNVNGTWHLFVVDQAAFDVGTIQCWSLSLTPSVCTDGGGECPGSDLAIGGSSAPEPLTIGGNLTYSFSITNFGPRAAKGVALSQVLPSSMVFIGASISQGSIGYSGGSVSGNIGNLPVGGVVTAAITMLPTQSGTFNSVASVAAISDVDFDLSNNSINVVSHVNPPTADMSVGITAAPNPVLVGGTLTYSIAVTNHGSSTATGVVVSNSISASVAVTSATASQGAVSILGNGVVLNLGSINAGAIATATITAIPSVQGQVTAVSTVQASQFDPIPANNTATIITSVSPSADLAVGFVNVPGSIVLGNTLNYTVSATNLGPSTAASVVINQTLPPNAQVISTSSTAGTTISKTNNVITCNVGSLPLGGVTTMNVQVSIPSSGNVTSSVFISGAVADGNPANNSAMVNTLVAPPFVSIQAASALLTAESFAPPDGTVEPGETVTVRLYLQNVGNVSTTNLMAKLLATGGVTSPTAATQTYGVLAPSGFPFSKLFSFTASGASGGTVGATLQLSGDISNTVTFTFQLPKVAAFVNTNVITIPDSGIASPYPSTINISGVTGLVGKVTATLSNFNHTYPHDVSVLLVSPAGISTLLMSHSADLGAPEVNVNFTFDDSAPAPLPQSGSAGSGSWQPSAYSPAPVFANPAPAAPYGATMLVFNNANPNGTWSLFVLDDSPGDQGGISNGWSLAITTLAPVNQTADLSVVGVASPSPVTAGNNLTYTFTITNNGPNSASVVAFTNTLPANVLYASAVVSQGTVSTNSGRVIASLGGLLPGASATVTIVVSPVAAGTLSSTAVVSANENDLSLGNNTATINSTVNLPVADVGIGQTASASPVVQGSNLVYTVTVTNVGPGTALNVVISDPLPAGLSYVSSSSGGVVGGTFTASLGNLAAGANSTITITNRAVSLGAVTNTVAVATGSTDSNSGNNSASVSTAIRAPATLITVLNAKLLAENFTPANGTVDPGETVSVALTLGNTGEIDTANLVATLLNTGGVTASSGSANYGAVVHNGPGISRAFTFTADPAASAGVIATLQLQDGANNLGTVSFTFLLPQTNSFNNTNAIIIPDHGIAAPYPATISVAGLTGLVSKVTVTLNGVTHAFPNDIGVLLVSPTGSKSVVMSGAGGGNAITNLTLVFDDAAASSLVATAPIVSGTFKPTSFPTNRTFLTPAPAGSATASFSQLNGESPNGVWSLYVVDDVTGDAGSINQGWSLAITTVSPVNSAADLSISASADHNQVGSGNSVTYTLLVNNIGSTAASGVIITNILPASAVLGTVNLSQGTYTSTGGAVICSLNNLNAGASASVTISATPTVTGTALDLALVSANEVDLDAANNTASVSVTVLPAAQAYLSSAVFNANHQFQLTLTGQPNLKYIVLATTNLATGTWTSVSTNTAASNGTFQFTDTNAPGLPSRFYRAMVAP